MVDGVGRKVVSADCDAGRLPRPTGDSTWPAGAHTGLYRSVRQLVAAFPPVANGGSSRVLDSCSGRGDRDRRFGWLEEPEPSDRSERDHRPAGQFDCCGAADDYGCEADDNGGGDDGAAHDVSCYNSAHNCGAFCAGPCCHLTASYELASYCRTDIFLLSDDQQRKLLRARRVLPDEGLWHDGSSRGRQADQVREQ